MRADVRIRAAEGRLPRLRALVPISAAVLVVCLVIGLSLSSRGLTGEVSQLWHDFTTTHIASNVNPSRFFSAASENRWVWWKEAAGAFSARPWLGWGAGSFPVVHLLYRQDMLPVQQPHSVPLQFLSETGIIGALLGMGALALLLVAGVRSVRRWLPGRDRLLAAALLAAGVAYVVHCCYDWDWNIPALSLPAFVFLGVLAAQRGGGSAPARTRTPRSPQSFSRVVALGSATLWLCAFTLSVLVPQIAADKASAALVDASSSSPAGLAQAQADASAASQLDPLSDQGLLAESSIASQRHQPGRAVMYLHEALARDPSDLFAWRVLVVLDANSGNVTAAGQAEQRALALDPAGKVAQATLLAQLHRAPPGLSPTHLPTPVR